MTDSQGNRLSSAPNIKGSSMARVLVIAGSDSGAGAGIQADLKTITVLGGYATTAITALTAQNTLGVQAIFPVPCHFVKSQALSVLQDIGSDIIKTGMLGSSRLIRTIAEIITDANVPAVIDPVMQAKGGHALIPDHALISLRRHLLPRAYLLTPNLPEAEILTGMAIRTLDDIEKAGRLILNMGPQAVLIKGGHASEDHRSLKNLGSLKNLAIDHLITRQGIMAFPAELIETPHTHGTGCSLASAIATFLAQGQDLETSVVKAKAFITAAIRKAPGLGSGHGPLGHFAACSA